MVTVSAGPRVPRDALWRLLRPRSVAVVGASETSFSAGVRAMLQRDFDLFLVNPTRSELFGRKTYPDLLTIGAPVDAVLSLVSAERSVDVVSSAAKLHVGGVVIFAAGFAESGTEGALLQDALCRAAGDRMAVLGPNCVGLMGVQRGTILATVSVPALPGGVALISHSGGFIHSVALAADERGVGLSHLITCGNEALTDMVDYLELLTEDSETRVICLVIEKMRRPDAFVRAAAAARAAGKPILALKLGRGVRARRIAQSHTGALVGDCAAYDAVFEQLGIIAVRDVAEMLDRASLFERLAPSHWTRARGVAFISGSGGSASLVSDICEQEQLQLPSLHELQEPLAADLGVGGTA
ncbi:MAG: CoA-binding protein, partial [Steroidobacteraceae bacterium]